MLVMLQWIFLALAVAFPFLVTIRNEGKVLAGIRRVAERRHLATVIVGVASFTGCALVVALLGEPVPVIHDEFSYLLMSNTLATGHVATPTPLPIEFFDTFHVLIKPVYASKYFPAQGLLLATGEFFVGHPIVGVWLGAAMASAATCWMLRAWIGPIGALVGGLLMVTQWSVFSYWGQSYWGGMAAALGGALVLGAARRLSDNPEWRAACLFGVGAATLAASRPAEGVLVLLPVSLVVVRHWCKHRAVRLGVLVPNVLLPIALIGVTSLTALGLYNRAITGSPVTPPYLLHEAQYQESPQLTLLPKRPDIAYSSRWVRRFYAGVEKQLYDSQQGVQNRLRRGARALIEWWYFYIGVLLTAPFITLVLLRGGAFARAEEVVLAGLVLTVICTRATCRDAGVRSSTSRCALARRQ